MSDKKLQITQTRSKARCTVPQVRTLEALGLRRIRQSVIKVDCAQLKGMLRVVNHLVEVKEVNL